MKLHLHDDKPAQPGEAHGPMGPTHFASVDVDYEYQAEMWIQDLDKDTPDCVRVECPALGREWKRDAASGKFIEVAK